MKDTITLIPTARTISFYEETEYFKIVNDKFGILNLFYFVNEKEILFSNNFWHLIKCLNITNDSIDYSELRRFIFFIGSNPNYTTFIKGIDILQPATLFHYNFDEDKFSFDRYGEYELLDRHELRII
jgi:hypothetical protein